MIRVRNLTQAYSQTPWRKQLQIIGLFLLGLIFSALVAGVYLNVTARTATMGREILSSLGDIKQKELKNADSLAHLANLQASVEMWKRAEDLGFRPIEKDQPIYLLVPGYVHREQADLAPLPDPVTSVPASLPSDYTESLFDWTWRQIPRLSDQFFELMP